MSQQYQHQLDFAVSLLKNLRIPVRFIHPGIPVPTLNDGLRQILNWKTTQEDSFFVASRRFEERTVYKITDQFLCHYIFFRLPGQESTSIVIGPYLINHLSPEAIREQAENLMLPMYIVPQLQSYYMSLPVYQDSSSLMAIILTLGESLWDGKDFHVADMTYEQPIQLPNLSPDQILIEQETILRQMEQMEERYAFENELMEIVSKGQTSRVSNITDHLSSLNFEHRHTDQLRNMKNYCIVCNTLLRKAAQHGGVHPIHLDKISSQFALTIENTLNQQKCVDLIGQMIREYCQLVRTHSGTQYSVLIQKTILYIEANLSGDLSLTNLAQLMQVTPGYLSARFHQETGHTLADHIADLRMKTALQLLKSTHLQIQAVAQLCGFSDPNYFGKLFKRFYGVTPLQYRNN